MTSASEELERLTRLEERHAAHVDLTRSNFEDIKRILGEQSEQLAEQTAAFNKYKGFWGAVTLIASAIATLFITLKEAFLTKLGLN